LNYDLLDGKKEKREKCVWNRKPIISLSAKIPRNKIRPLSLFALPSLDDQNVIEMH